MNIAVIDDWKSDRIQLMKSIYQYTKENSIAVHLTPYENGEDFLQRADISCLDAIFLDIYMLGINGMDVAEKIRQISETCIIVFVTATADFAVKSYEVRAFDYLLKPVASERFLTVMKRIEKNMEKCARFIVVKEGRELRKVFLSELIYIDYSNHYVKFHTQSEIISTYAKFGEFEFILLKYPMFMTCYRCIMVNMDQIEKTEENFFLMKNGEYIPINRVNAKAIRVKYINYIFEHIDESEA